MKPDETGASLAGLKLRLVPGDCVLTTYGVVVVTKIREAEGGEGNDNADDNGIVQGGKGTDGNEGAEEEDAAAKAGASGSAHSPPAGLNVTTEGGLGPEQVAVYQFECRLWRHPEKSIASSSYAVLRSDCVIKPLPAAPGMTTTVKEMVDGGDGSKTDVSEPRATTEKQDVPAPEAKESPRRQVLLLCYSMSRDVYIANEVVDSSSSSLNSNASSSAKTAGTDHNKDGYETPRKEKKEVGLEKPPPPVPRLLVELHPSQLYPSKSCKFYPLLVDLLTRADQAANAATNLVVSTVGGVVTQELVTSMSDQSRDAIEDAMAPLQPKITASAKKLQQTATELVSSANAEEATQQVSQILTMLKDEELTTLLERGRQRLEQLMTHDLPQVQSQVLSDLGIDFTSPSVLHSSSIVPSREKALQALNDLLSTHTGITNVEELRTQLGNQFTDVFDQLTVVAQSDPKLQEIFTTINEKTLEWQQATGRLLQTRSANLFMEGAGRLQARAATLFSHEQLQFAKESSLILTKGFTEGDAALAKLKGIELGDAVRSRLFSAIELRSGSEGGLDGIIAGALTSLQATTSKVLGDAGNVEAGQVQDSIQMTIASLQSSATTAAKSAHETLLTTLAQKSQYRDAAAFQIERTLVSLEEEFGDDITPEQIAGLARGEGGTSVLFDPIAKRATKEINYQLDVAESSITDPTVREVIKHVRRIISGELSLEKLTDEVIKVLNDDTSVEAGEKLVLQGERLLDVLESATKNKYVEDVMGVVVESSGLTKENVVQSLESLDMNTIVGTAEQAVTDENARREILSSAADSALDFLLKILPSMPVPPFDGVRDGLVYHLSNLSMEGFKVRKEDILVEIAGIKAVERDDVDAAIRGDEDEEDGDENVTLLRSKEEEEDFLRRGGDSGLAGDEGGVGGEEDEEETTTTDNTVKATELLIIDVRNISAVLENAVWSFEQTYFPYLKGQGTANVQLSEGSIRLQFELRKRRIRFAANGAEDSGPEWEPVLCLHRHDCDISEIDLRLDGSGKVVWVLNKLATYLKGPLCTYVVKSVQRTLGNGSGMLLEKLNDTLGSYWGVVLKMAGLTMDDLTELTATDVVQAEKTEFVDEIELVWRESLPLGMNLLMNDDGGLIKVVEFPRGSQARSVAENRQFDPDGFKGATITAVNGIRYDEDSQEELLEALKDPGRPKTITFLLSDSEEAERIRLFCAGLDEGTEKNDDGSEEEDVSSSVAENTVESVVVTEEGPLGIQFSNALDDFTLVVEGFSRGDEGEKLQTESSAKIFKGDLLVSINGESVVGAEGSGRKRALDLFEDVGARRPLTMEFARPFLIPRSFLKPGDVDTDEGGPHREMEFDEVKQPCGKKRIVLKRFKNVAGKVEAAKVFLGDFIICVNGVPVGAAATDLRMTDIDQIVGMIGNDEAYPLSLVFARPKGSESRWKSSGPSFDQGSAQKFHITADCREELGCHFGRGQGAGHLVVTSFQAVKGPIQRELASDGGTRRWLGLTVESINGQVVPSYASGDMVSKALESSWARNGKAEVLFCDDRRKEWLEGLGNKTAS